jgi:hypothetical protein
MFTCVKATSFHLYIRFALAALSLNIHISLGYHTYTPPHLSIIPFFPTKEASCLFLVQLRENLLSLGAGGVDISHH